VGHLFGDRPKAMPMAGPGYHCQTLLDYVEQAERLLAEALSAAGLILAQLAALPGSEVRKGAIASLIRERTTVSHARLSERLHLRSPANAGHQIRRQKLTLPTLPKFLQKWPRQSRNAA
jgi:hypothetical protein